MLEGMELGTLSPDRLLVRGLLERTERWTHWLRDFFQFVKERGHLLDNGEHRSE